jgi:3-deoxy-D-manno-octulosonate 8-phosphate phosphatase (KDO 8-P phosphatase)
MGIITGEDNVTARYLATREHYHFVYSQSKDKAAAFHHFLSMTSLTPEQVVYVFDDVSDLAVAEQCGIRFLIYRRASPCFLDFTTRHHLVDYIAAQEGGAHAVREVCELILAFTDMYDEAVTHRYRYSDIYKLYWKERQSIETSFYQPGYQGNLVLSEQHQNIA